MTLDGSERTRRTLLCVWCLFILYGSFIPFKFTAGPATLRHKVDSIQVFPFEKGRRVFSTLDVASNVALFVPFGFLVAASGSRAANSGRWSRRVLASGALAAGFAALIEVGQLFAPGRTSSVLDVGANVAGALTGATVAALVLPALGGALGARLSKLARAEPRLIPLALLALALAAGSFYPFAITLDVSTAWNNLKRGQWVPFGSLGRRFWADLLVDKALSFALLAILARQTLRHRFAQIPASGLAWMATVLFGAGLEAGKLLFAGRFPSVDNVILAATGALIGVTVIPFLLHWDAFRTRAAWALLLLALLLVAYAELRPFQFRLTPGSVSARAARIEWLPLFGYYRADAQRALFDVWQKLLLSGLLGFAVSAVRETNGKGAVLAGLLAGGLLEAAQLLTVARHTSVSDVLIFGLGAWIGGVGYAWYRSVRREGEVGEPQRGPRGTRTESVLLDWGRREG